IPQFPVSNRGATSLRHGHRIGRVAPRCAAPGDAQKTTLSVAPGTVPPAGCFRGMGQGRSERQPEPAQRPGPRLMALDTAHTISPWRRHPQLESQNLRYLLLRVIREQLICNRPAYLVAFVTPRKCCQAAPIARTRRVLISSSIAIRVSSRAGRGKSSPRARPATRMPPAAALPAPAARHEPRHRANATIYPAIADTLPLSGPLRAFVSGKLSGPTAGQDLSTLLRFVL